MHLYNLFLAAMWLLLGAWLLIHDYLHPGGGTTFSIGGTDISLGWIAVVLAGYNVARWWGRRAARQARQQREEFERRRELARRDREFRESGREPDPNFNFDEPPRRET
jgi:hypothetical protein